MKNKIKIIILFLTILVIRCGSEFETLLDNKDTDITWSDIYWSEVSGTVNSINTDGTGRKTIITLSNAPLDIDLDVQGGRIFWAEKSGSAYQIGRVDLDGSGSVFVYSTSISDFGPASISIDNSNGTIFWYEYKNLGSLKNIWKSDITAGALSKESWLSNTANIYVYSICVDTINRKMYFTANSYYDIGTPIGNSNVGNASIGELDTTSTGQVKSTGTGSTSPLVPFKDIAVDGEGGHTYYVLNSDVPLCIRRRDLALNNPETWISASGFDIQKIALDLKNRKIYWTSNYSSQYRIYRADLDISNSNVEVFLTLSNPPTGIAISQ